MRLDITLPDLTPSCCDNLVYAIVFDKNQRALKDNGFGVLSLQPYINSNHNGYAIILAEDAERDRYYFIDLLDAQFNLPDNPKGETYQVEFWRKPTAGTFSRSDELRETRRVCVVGKQIVDATLSAGGVNELANWQAHVSAVYDSELGILRFMAHLDNNGALITDSKLAAIQVFDSAGTQLISVSQSTYVTGLAGVFAVELANQNLDNDQCFAVKCAITDVNNVQHTTVSYLNTWD